MLFSEGMSIGEKLMNALGITILGMVVVFVVLIVLSYILDLLRVVSGEKKESAPNARAVNTENKNIAKNDTQNEEELAAVIASAVAAASNDGELIAVIAAAVSAASGIAMNNLVVRSIKPVPQKHSAWATAGRQEQLFGKF